MGTEYKIDASYISPNIAITAMVEQATQHFRVPLLVTEHVVQLCSPGVAEICRKIDRVSIMGNKDPMDLHCVDIDPWVLALDGPRKPNIWNPRERYKVRQFMESERNRNRLDDDLATRTVHKDMSVRQMRHQFTVPFEQTFKMGFKNYVEGEWQVAQQLLSQACEILGAGDGPSESLLAFMHKTRYEAPSDWRGYRDMAPLLQGPPKIMPRNSRTPTVNVQGSLLPTDFDFMAFPSEGGFQDIHASWQLPNVPLSSSSPRPSPGKSGSQLGIDKDFMTSGSDSNRPSGSSNPGAPRVSGTSSITSVPTTSSPSSPEVRTVSLKIPSCSNEEVAEDCPPQDASV